MKVYTYKHDGRISEDECEDFGYPNKTASGETMYDNTYFTTREAAIAYGISEETAGIRLDVRALERAEEEVRRLKDSITKQQVNIEALRRLPDPKNPTSSIGGKEPKEDRPKGEEESE